MVDVRAVVARAPLRTIRPRDLRGIYAAPRRAVERLSDQNVLRRIAPGFYTLVPLDADPDTWCPAPEVAAVAVAAAAFGVQDVAIMGLSAARIHGALPRAMGRAWVAVPAQRRPTALADGASARFMCRDVETLDVEPTATELGKALVTTPAQTALDVARDPRALEDSDVRSMAEHLLAMDGFDRVSEIAERQGRTRAAVQRLRAVR